MTVPHLDKSEWPLVQFYWEGQPSDADVDEHFNQIAELIQTGQSFAIVTHLTGLDNPGAMLRRRVADHMTKLKAELKEGSIICNAHVITSSVVRGVLTAIYWLAPAPFEIRFFATAPAAEAWARQRLAQATGQSKTTQVAGQVSDN